MSPMLCFLPFHSLLLSFLQLPSFPSASFLLATIRSEDSLKWLHKVIQSQAIHQRDWHPPPTQTVLRTGGTKPGQLSARIQKRLAQHYLCFSLLSSTEERNFLSSLEKMLLAAQVFAGRTLKSSAEQQVTKQTNSSPGPSNSFLGIKMASPSSRWWQVFQESPQSRGQPGMLWQRSTELTTVPSSHNLLCSLLLPSELLRFPRTLQLVLLCYSLLSLLNKANGQCYW